MIHIYIYICIYFYIYTQSAPPSLSVQDDERRRHGRDNDDGRGWDPRRPPPEQLVWAHQVTDAVHEGQVLRLGELQETGMPGFPTHPQQHADCPRDEPGVAVKVQLAILEEVGHRGHKETKTETVRGLAGQSSHRNT
jgi:hypothetical protein